MKGMRILRCLGQISDKYILEAAPGKTEKRKRGWEKWACAAVCIGIMAACGWLWRLVRDEAPTQAHPTAVLVQTIPDPSQPDSQEGENVGFRLPGEGRPEERVSIEGGAVTLPAGAMIALEGWTLGTPRQQAELTDGEWLLLISLMETARAVETEQAIDPNRRTWGCSAYLTMQNENGDEIRILLEPFDDGFVSVNIQYESAGYDESTRMIFLQSEELTEEIKRITGWRLIDMVDLASAERIVYRWGGQEYELGEQEREKVIEGLGRARQEKLETGCPYDVEIWFYLEDGERICGLWCGDTCRYMAVEGGLYLLEEEDGEYIAAEMERLGFGSMAQKR